MRTTQDFANKHRVDAARPKMPWLKKGLMVALLMGLVAVLGLLLWEKYSVEVKQPFMDQNATPVIKAVTQEAKPKPETKVIEQASASDFTYGTMLKQAEVTPAYVPVYESTPKDPTKKTSHVLQVASFKSEVDARALQKRLIKKKLTNVQVTQSKAKLGSIWYRVMVGPFQNRSMLNKAQDILVQMNFSPLERKQ
ncbi:SPOR domain-containing protein [Oceanospirillaceae bacterium]|jgi:cell division protein FtsN|nr:SPOR domain-containing protein [Oceanospirillaceae bacterium]